MKWNYLKGSEKDFEGAPEWAVYLASVDAVVGKLFAFEITDFRRYAYANHGCGHEIANKEFYGSFIKQWWFNEPEIIAQREPISTPKHIMIFGDPKSFIFAHEEATHAAKNKVTGEVVHTHIPGLINLSKFDFIAQRQLTDVTESDLNECIGASEALELPKITVNTGGVHFNGHEYIMPIIGIMDNVKVGSLHLDGKEHSAPLGNKYMREIAPDVWVDVYAVLKAWNVTNPALQHLIKKALQPGERGHKTLHQDMQDIIDSAIRAKELEVK